MRANCSKMRFRTVSAYCSMRAYCTCPAYCTKPTKDREKVVKAKTKKIHGVEVGYNCLCVRSRISRFFLHSLF